MPADKFWHIIERAARSDHDPDAHVEALRTALRELTLEEVISFDVAFERYLDEAYTWSLWGAAYVIHGGCSDDGFEYFRRWLISRGRKVYEAALANPDNLAELEVRPGPDGMWKFEEVYHVALEVFSEKSGEDDRQYSEPGAGMVGSGPSGEPLVREGEEEPEEEHLALRYPKLWRRFGDEPLG